MIETLTPELRKQAKRYMKIELSKRNLFDYCQFVDSEEFYNEEYAPYLKEICDAIQEFENDDNEALIVNMPPRHRKNKNSK